jgi:hypothetical protein
MFLSASTSVWAAPQSNTPKGSSGLRREYLRIALLYSFIAGSSSESGLAGSLKYVHPGQGLANRVGGARFAADLANRVRGDEIRPRLTNPGGEVRAGAP